MRHLSVFLLALLTSVPVLAQSSDPPIQGPASPVPPAVIARDEQGRVTMRATKVPSPFVFDGALDEPFYRDVQSVGDFIQQEPHEGQPATDKTEVWVFFDKDYLYVSARLYDAGPDKRVSTEMRRDANTLYNNDHFAVVFDSFYDHRNGYGFAVNTLGGMLDWSTTNEQINNNWNGQWDVKTGTFSDGWTVEIRFPFRSFRFRENGHIWGMNFRRRVIYKNEVSFLSPVPAAWGRQGMSKMSTTATVTGIEVPGKGKNIDIKPYALGSMLTDTATKPPVSNKPDANAGFDVKWGIRQTLVADLTVNTDFAQVEDDLQVVNLSRFSVLFPEKRDFFLEGADTFNFANGSSGTGGTGGGGGTVGSGQNTSTAPLVFYSRRIGLSSNGLTVPIRAGGRLLGRSGPWQYGLLNIQSGESTDANAPSTNFSVIRVNHDLFKRSRIGAIFTRRDPIAATKAGLGGPDNLAYGVDTQISPTTETTILGYAAKTDSPDLTGDDTSYRGRLDWTPDKYGAQAEYLSVGTDFNPEVGFLRRTAFKRSYGQLRYSPRPGWKYVRKLYFLGSVDYITDPTLRPESKEVQGTYQMEFESSDTLSTDFSQNYERLTTRFAVGSGVFVPPGEYNTHQWHATYAMGQQRPVSGSITAGHSGFYGGTLTEFAWTGRVELSKQFYVEPTLSWNHVDVPQGIADNNLFSTRATYTLSPRMFVSALVQYQARTSSVASNARLRWEYRPGSELFVVYSDGRTTLNNTGFPDLLNRSFVVKITKLWRW